MANPQRDSRNRTEERVEVAGTGAATAQGSEESKRGRSEQEREGHANAIGVEPVQCGAPHPRGERHSAVNDVRLAKGQLARSFDLRAGVIAVQKRGIA